MAAGCKAGRITDINTSDVGFDWSAHLRIRLAHSMFFHIVIKRVKTNKTKNALVRSLAAELQCLQTWELNRNV